MSCLASILFVKMRFLIWVLAHFPYHSILCSSCSPSLPLILVPNSISSYIASQIALLKTCKLREICGQVGANKANLCDLTNVTAYNMQAWPTVFKARLLGITSTWLLAAEMQRGQTMQ